jgi:hypothetical protein
MPAHAPNPPFGQALKLHPLDYQGGIPICVPDFKSRGCLGVWGVDGLFHQAPKGVDGLAYVELYISKLTQQATTLQGVAKSLNDQVAILESKRDILTKALDNKRTMPEITQPDDCQDGEPLTFNGGLRPQDYQTRDGESACIPDNVRVGGQDQNGCFHPAPNNFTGLVNVAKLIANLTGQAGILQGDAKQLTTQAQALQTEADGLKMELAASKKPVDVPK